MIFGQKNSIGPIGLDLGARHVKAVQLRKSADGAWWLHAAASIPRAEGVDKARRLAEILDRRGFKGRDVVLAVPSKTLQATNLELPVRTPQMPFEQIARQEFARAIKQESSAFEFAFWDLPAPARAAKATHVMAVGCALAESEPILDEFTSARLSVLALDIEACAIARACTPLLAPPEQITAIVDIGWSSSRLSIVHQGVISYWRSLDGLGVGALRNSLAKQLDVPDDVVEHLFGDRETLAGKLDDNVIANQARRAISSHSDSLIAEITTSLSYAAHQYPDAPVSRVLMVGGGAIQAGISEYFGAQLGVDVKLVAMNDVIGMESTDPELSGPQMMLAAGLAQYEGD